MDMNNPEVTVFVETSLHTHLAVTARGNDTVSELKTILESEHRYLGRIKIQSLKINRNECWYHLSDSIHVRRVVNGDNQEGFLFADALSLEKDTSEDCNSVVKNASHSQPASKKKRKFEEVTGLEDSLKEKNRSERPSQKKRKFKKVTSLEDSLKENNILICDSGAEIPSELLSVSVADSCKKFHSTNSSRRKKDRKKNKSPNPLNQVVDAAPARRGDTEGISIVASTRINVEIPEGEDVAYTGRQGQQENHCTPPQVLQGHHEVPSSLDVDSVTNAGTLERKRSASAEKPDGHPSVGVKGPTQDGTGSAEKALEETKPSQKIEAEAMPTKKHRIPEKGTRDGKDATSKLLNTDETVTSGRKKNKKKKANDVNGVYLLKSGTEHIVGSETDISLAEPHEAVQAEKGSDKAREEDNDLSLKNGEDISEKETEGGTGSAEKALEETELSQKTDSEAMLIEKHNFPDKETEGGTGSAEKALEETELSQKTDSEAMLIEKHEVPDKGKRDGNDATSELLNTDGSVAPSKKKNKRKKQKKTNDVNGVYLVKSGTEHIVGSETDISLAEPHEAVQAGKGSDKAREEDNDLSLKNVEDISEKETEGGTGSAEKALEETELSQKTDSEAMLVEKHEVPDKGKRDGNDATSELLNTVGSVAPSKKKNERKKEKKTNDVNGDYLVKSGTEHIVGSETDISLAEPHEAAQTEKGSDKAREEDNDLDISEKETEGGTGSAEIALEETELSQKTDYEAMLIEKHEVPDKGKRDGNNATSELLNTDGSVTPSKKKNKRKKPKKTNDVNGDYLVKSGTEHIVGLETDISLAEPHEAVQAEKGSDKASEEDSNLPLKKEKVVLEKETKSSPSVGTDLHKLQGNESKRKRGDDTTDLHKLQEEKNVCHQAQTNRRKKSRLAKTIDQLNVKYPKEDSGVQFDPLRACSNSMSESTEVLSHAKQNTSVGRPLKPDQSGKLLEHFKFDVPDQIQKEVSSGEVLAEEVARSKESDDNLMPKRNRKNRDLTSHSSHLQSPLKSHDYQRIGEKSEAGNSISVQQGGSQPEKMFPKEVAKTGAKAVSSDASGNINSTPKEAGKQSVTNASDSITPVEKRNEGLSNSDMKKSSNQVQSKMGKKHQSGADHNVVASGKASGIGNGEVLNNPNNRKSSAALVGGDKNGSSKGRDEAVVSGITTSSEYSLSSESDYSDGDSNAGYCASSGKKTSGRIGYSSIKSTPARRLKNDEIFLKSSIYKKAKLAVTLSQMEEDSQAAVEFVPDSQRI